MVDLDVELFLPFFNGTCESWCRFFLTIVT